MDSSSQYSQMLESHKPPLPWNARKRQINNLKTLHVENVISEVTENALKKALCGTYSKHIQPCGV